jgi:hypothetical protein
MPVCTSATVSVSPNHSSIAERNTYARVTVSSKRCVRYCYCYCYCYMVQELPEHPVGSQRGSWGTRYSDTLRCWPGARERKCRWIGPSALHVLRREWKPLKLAQTTAICRMRWVAFQPPIHLAVGKEYSWYMRLRQQQPQQHTAGSSSGSSTQQAAGPNGDGRYPLH